MEELLDYNGYLAKVRFSEKDEVFYGRVEGLNDLITFESDSAHTLKEEFHKAVDDYLDFCQRMGKEPEKTYKGTFNVRIDPDLHRRLALLSLQMGTSLNDQVDRAIFNHVNDAARSHDDSVNFAVIASMVTTLAQKWQDSAYRLEHTDFKNIESSISRRD